MRAFLASAIAAVSVCFSTCTSGAGAPIKAALCRPIAPPAQYTIAAAATALAGHDELSGFSAIAAADQAAASETRFRIGWDGKNLLVLTTCPLKDGRQPVAPVRSEDGDIWFDDAIEVFVQPSAAGPYYHFGWNAAGSRSDEIGNDRTWDGKWRVMVEVTAKRWRSLAVIPFTDVEAEPTSGAVWRFNVCRDDAANHEFSSWSFSGGGFHNPDRFAWLLFADSAMKELSRDTLRQLQRILYDPGAVAEVREDIRAALAAATKQYGQGAAMPPPLAKLLKELRAVDAELTKAQKRFEAAGIDEFAALVERGRAVPGQIEAARRAMQLWKIEKLLLKYERSGGRR